jgi:hypothetical protein
MAVRLAAIQASVATTWTYLQSPQLSPQGATSVGVAALDSLHALLQADNEQLQGWWRAALLLSDANHALLLDMLGASPLEMCQLRISALRDLPEIGATNSLADIHTGIAGAINIGAPRYNAGDIIGCCTVYWATLMALVSAPVLRGFPGYARAIAPLREIAEQEPPPLPIIGQGVDEFAWQLRHALDAVLAING